MWARGGWLLAEGAPAFFSLVIAHFDGDVHTLDFHRAASSGRDSIFGVLKRRLLPL